ncbi:glycosyltransferase [Dawidia soli]|uniref:Glycosyltransferase family 4 protein n=1 Tax=Dawidia soli TaxID=2782352 RepID=A0AAP2D9A6_9BACT|nr:glycosyltransferase [Dawidia soli]MBT1686460.1 glycosyltransferase family 4 protein [Dawidia soli]
MTVLMFGWEFPPHLSGGLGTACLGLATALKEQDVKLLFVVPKAHGDESIPLINASGVTLAADETVVRTVHKRSDTGSREIAVAATIRPYATGAATRAVEHWHWQYATETLRTVKSGSGIRYSFSGGYGPSLMEEVARYADVAGAIARQNNFDVIHAHDWLSFPAGVEAKNVSGKPLIVHVHATEIDRAGENNIDRRVFDIERQGMQAADLVIAVSQWTKDILVRKYDIHPAKIHVVHNGVMPVQVDHWPVTPKISEHVVTFLGRVTYQKGPLYFIEAARKVLDYFPDAHFIMAGSGDLLPAMIDRVARGKMSSRVHFTGFLRGKQIHQVWSVTDVYVMPSVSEPFGITPLEAVQAGVPVIVSNQSGVAEVMDHVIKVDFWDTRALANAIIGVLRHKVLSDSLRSNGRKEIEALTWKRAAGKIKQLYHEF